MITIRVVLILTSPFKSTYIFSFHYFDFMRFFSSFNNEELQHSLMKGAFLREFFLIISDAILPLIWLQLDFFFLEILSHMWLLLTQQTVLCIYKYAWTKYKTKLLNISQLEIILTKLHRKCTSHDNEMITATLSADITTINPRKAGKSRFIAYGI